MLANDITLDKQDGTDVVYRLLSQDAQGSRRIDITTNLSAPKLMTIRHSVQGKGVDAVDRHLVSLTQTLAGSLAPRTLTVNFTVAVPRDTVVTSTIVKDLITNLIDFLADGSIASLATMANVDAVLRGES